MPIAPSRNRLENTPTEHSDAWSVRTANAVPTWHATMPSQATGGGLPVGVVEGTAGTGGGAGVPSAVTEREVETGHDEDGGDEAEESPGAGQHWPADHTLVAGPRGAQVMQRGPPWPRPSSLPGSVTTSMPCLRSCL